MLSFESEHECACVPFSPTPAHKPSCSASRGRPGSQCAVVMGTRQRWPVPSSLLYSPVQRAPRQQLDCPVRISKPRDTLLHRGQVNVKVHVGSFYYSCGKKIKTVLGRTSWWHTYFSFKVKAFHFLPVPFKSHQWHWRQRIQPGEWGYHYTAGW